MRNGLELVKGEQKQGSVNQKLPQRLPTPINRAFFAVKTRPALYHNRITIRVLTPFPLPSYEHAI